MLNFLRSQPAKALSVPQVRAAVASGEMLLVDVRERAEVLASGTAEGALHVPLSLITLKADPRGPGFDGRFAGKTVAVFCASGARSGMAVQALQKLGYSAVNLGGFGAWVQAGGPVSRL
jgi:rhodanese-related sulfurtransferase